ncbi:MAG: MinD/ParA family protein [Planctomycetota bacterium]
MSAIPLDQASRLRAMMDAPTARTVTVPRRRARVLAIASGKGGVGKTNIAVNLSLALARRGRRVVLVDADIGTANVDVLFNVQSRFDLSHVVQRKKRLDEITVKIDPGLRFVPGASGLADVTDLAPQDRIVLLDEMSRLETQCDLLLLDCGAGISQNVLAFAGAADEILVVTTPEPTALTDAYALIKVLHRAACPALYSLVVNQAESQREAHAVYERLAATAERFLGLRISAAGQVLRDPCVPLAVRQRAPFFRQYPRCPASTCVAALAERVDRRDPDASDPRGFFDRLLTFFN